MPFSHYYGLWKNIPRCLPQIQMGLAGRLRRHNLSIGYVAPEAAIGGPLNAVADGDEIEININERKLQLLVSEEEIKQRQSEVKWEFDSKNCTPFLRMFARNVTSTAKGATWY